MVWVHGLGEHGGRYLHVAEALADVGWSMILPDLRGHGLSAGTRTHVTSFEEYCDDIAAVWQHFQLTTPQRPEGHLAVLGAHSMGGLVAIRSLQTKAIAPQALVLTSPLLAVKVHVSPWKKWLGQVAVKAFPTLRFANGLKSANMTCDPEFAEKRRNDPLMDRTVTAGWFFAMQRALADVRRDASRIAIPVQAFRGLKDETTCGDTLADWLAATQSPNVDLVSLPDHVHELLHSSDWRVTLDRMLAWMDRSGTGRV